MIGSLRAVSGCIKTVYASKCTQWSLDIKRPHETLRKRTDSFRSPLFWVLLLSLATNPRFPACAECFLGMIAGGSSGDSSKIKQAFPKVDSMAAIHVTMALCQARGTADDARGLSSGLNMPAVAT